MNWFRRLFHLPDRTLAHARSELRVRRADRELAEWQRVRVEMLRVEEALRSQRRG